MSNWPICCVGVRWSMYASMRCIRLAVGVGAGVVPRVGEGNGDGDGWGERTAVGVAGCWPGVVEVDHKRPMTSTQRMMVARLKLMRTNRKRRGLLPAALC